jgi:hypothetical protein
MATELEGFDKKKHNSSHYRREGDGMPLAGEARTPGKLVTFGQEGIDHGLTHRDCPLAEVNSAKEHEGDDKAVKWLEEDYLPFMLNTVTKMDDVNDTGLINHGLGAVSEGERKNAGSVISKGKDQVSRTWNSVSSVIVAQAGRVDEDRIEQAVYMMVDAQVTLTDLPVDNARLKD